jgi:putative tricarboxylic transport membrane protein
LLGILLIATISTGSRLKALIAATVGLLLATVGRDGFTGAERFTFDNLSLADGLDFVPIAMGLFGLGEILYNLEDRHRGTRQPATIANIWPSRADLRQSSGAIGRGSILGFVLGILPGGGAVLSSMAAYAIERRRSRHPERFGHGAIEGVAAPEAANNAAATSSFIPLLSSGSRPTPPWPSSSARCSSRASPPARNWSPRNRNSSGASSTRCTSATSS